MADSSFYFGVVFDLGGQEIALEPLTDIQKARTYGIECALDQPLALGSAQDNLESVLTSIGVDSSAIVSNGQVNSDLTDIPVVGDIVTGLLQADLTVEQFYLKIPGSNGGDTRYTLGLSATWNVEGGEGKLIGDLSLKGLYLKVSNEDAAAASTASPSPTA